MKNNCPCINCDARHVSEYALECLSSKASKAWGREE